MPRSPIRLPRFHAYLLHSQKTGQIYLGYTSDLRRRFKEHNAADNSGWTRRGQPWRLLAVQTYFDRHSAQLAERRLKNSRFDKSKWIKSLERLDKLKVLGNRKI